MTEIEMVIEVLQDREVCRECTHNSRVNENPACEECEEAFKKAYEALQEKAEREKGCKYCNNHRPLLALYTEYSIEVDDRELSVWQGLKCEGTLKISFCPMCGRKLEGKQ